MLRAEIARKRGHMPIRKLMEKAAPAVQALKPVFMMSPLSVAQFLAPGLFDFDLLVMDEASQIQPVDALGAVARAKQVVVVGDPKQLPPTAFFSKMTGGGADDDDDAGTRVTDIESILGLFTARGLPMRMLRWHYRSKHQSLIAVSNRQFYENKLFIVPSPYTAEAGMGLRFHRIPQGVFDAGATRTNMVEATRPLSHRHRVRWRIISRRPLGPRSRSASSVGPREPRLDDPPHLEHRLVPAAQGTDRPRHRTDRGGQGRA
ncbi:AAA domain-containing protein [Sphingomonas sp. LR55]